MANHVSPHGGPYASKDKVLYTELNDLIDAVIASPNFDAGSAHAPTGDIELSGSMGGGFAFADDFPFSGEIDAAGDVTVNASSAALWTFTADVTVQTLGPVEFYGVTTLKSGGTFVTAAGSTTTFGAQVYFDGLVDFRSGSDVEIKSGCTWDFDAGATVGLAATMTVTGQITVSGTGNISVASSGQILGASGSILTWLGTANFQNEVNFTSGSDVEVKSGAAWDFESGSTLGLAGTTSITGATTFASGTYPLLSSRTWTERATRIASTTYGTNGADPGPADANMWVRRDSVESVPTYYSDIATTVGCESVIELTNLPHGQTITSVSLKTDGVNGTTPDFYPTYRVVRWLEGGSAFEVMSNVTNDEHATTLDWGAAQQVTEITITANATIDRSYHYGVRVIHPYESPTGTGVQIFDIWAEGTQTSLQR